MHRIINRVMGPVSAAALLAMLVGCTNYPSTSTGLTSAAPSSSSTATPAATAPADTRPAATAPPTGELERLLPDLDHDAADYLQHVVTLSNTYFEGRAPGYRGNHLAADYLEWHFTRLGLEPAFPEVGGLGDVAAGSGGPNYQQAMSVNGDTEVLDARASYTVDGETFTLEPEDDFNPMAVASDGSATGQVVFVGYALESEEHEYSSFDDDTDLTGKIALMLRFEPMDARGKSLWADRSRWTREASLMPKIANCVDRGAAGVILVNSPGADDPRADEMETVKTSRWGQSIGVPMVMLSQKAAKRMVDRIAPEGRSLLDLRRLADQGEVTAVALDKGGATFSMTTDLEIAQIPTTNVGAILRGSGDLADEWVIIGGHYDHVGYGFFGSRAPNAAGTIHPGADDNASGAAGVLLAAKLLTERYQKARGDRRSILFLGFTAEEMGLLGAKHFVGVMGLGSSDVTAMINMDMIGRLSDNKLTVYGVGTAPEWDSLVPRHFAGFDLSQIKAGTGPSDHTWFYREDIPVLHVFSGLHEQYHRPDDKWPLINYGGAVRIVRHVADLVMDLATARNQLAFTQTQGSARPGSPRMGDMKVRLGIAPASYDEGQVGIPIGGVSPDTSAADAGLREGDIITHWNGEEIGGMRGLMQNLLAAEPGDEVRMTITRDGQTLEVPVTLKAREGRQ